MPNYDRETADKGRKYLKRGKRPKKRKLTNVAKALNPGKFEKIKASDKQMAEAADYIAKNSDRKPKNKKKSTKGSITRMADNSKKAITDSGKGKKRMKGGYATDKPRPKRKAVRSSDKARAKRSPRRSPQVSSRTITRSTPRTPSKSKTSSRTITR